VKHAVLPWLVVLAIAGAPGKGDAAQRPDPASRVSGITTLKEGGARMDWLDHRDQAVVADLSWRPDGTAFAACYHERRALASKHVPTKIILVELGPR
jgi:hypothetical protein